MFSLYHYPRMALKADWSAKNFVKRYNFMCTKRQAASHSLARSLFRYTTLQKTMTRPPIVTIMGHVDHGKTTLLDHLRSTVTKEHGGITQHLSAFPVKVNDQSITFIDTPGHKAFKDIREHAATVSDIVILVVDVGEGVMEQTKECIQWIQQAKVSVIIAVTKCDGLEVAQRVDDSRKPAVYKKQTESIQRQLAIHGIICEDLGGTVQLRLISALKGGKGVYELLESIIVEAEMLELRTCKSRPASGYILESRTRRGMGPCSLLLIKDGVVRKGDWICSGNSKCRVRTITSFDGKSGKEVAFASEAVEVSGWRSQPENGASFQVHKSQKSIKQLVKEAEKHLGLETSEKINAISTQYAEINKRILQDRRAQVVQNKSSSLKTALRIPLKQTLYYEDYVGEDGKKPCLNLILCGDTEGSLTALNTQIQSIPQKKVRVNIVEATVGAPTETLYLLAKTTKSVILTFNCPANSKISSDSDLIKSVHVQNESIIYRLDEWIRNKMLSMVPPTWTMVTVGKVKVLEIFSVDKGVPVIGCTIVDGHVALRENDSSAGNDDNEDPIVCKSSNLMIEKDHFVAIKSIRCGKKQVKKVSLGADCGIMIDSNEYEIAYLESLIGSEIDFVEERLDKLTLE